MFGSSIILHVRSNFALEDFHCLVTSRGQLLTTRLISMGNTKLKTFDEIVTFSMAPEATFLIWHVDNWGRTISASVTVPIFGHEKGHLDAHPVLEGNSGFTQVLISGEPNAYVLLNAMEQDEWLRGRGSYLDWGFDEVTENIIISHSNGRVSATNLIVMSDSRDSFDDASDLACEDRGLFACSAILSDCYSFLEICDGTCHCNDCIDEHRCGGQSEPTTSAASPVLTEVAFNDFWRVVKLPPNGTLSFRVPFAKHGKLYLGANALGSRGVFDLGARIINVGTNVRFHMELPTRAKLGETLSLRFSGINEGNIHIKRTFAVYSSSRRDFTFVSANGHSLV